jgi:hypothetical protein
MQKSLHLQNSQLQGTPDAGFSVFRWGDTEG